MLENCENDPNCMGFPYLNIKCCVLNFQKKKKNYGHFKDMGFLNLQNVYDETLKCYL